MDLDEAGHIALADLARQTAVQEPLIDALLATRSCLGPFRVNIGRKDVDASALSADQSLLGQMPEGMVTNRDFAIHSLREAIDELDSPGRVLVFPCRNPTRLCEETVPYRAIGAFDYEVRDSFRSACHFLAAFQSQEGLGMPIAAILEWPEDWDEEWQPSDLQLCNRLRMLIVQAFRGEAYLIARRESESDASERVPQKLRTLEWRETVPAGPPHQRVPARPPLVGNAPPSMWV